MTTDSSLIPVPGVDPVLDQLPGFELIFLNPFCAEFAGERCGHHVEIKIIKMPNGRLLFTMTVDNDDEHPVFCAEPLSSAQLKISEWMALNEIEGGTDENSIC
jgi:hypothetical protein